MSEEHDKRDKLMESFRDYMQKAIDKAKEDFVKGRAVPKEKPPWKATEEVPDGDSVHHPSHYGGDTTYETIKVIEAWGLGFHLGNAVKYISRAGKKGDTVEDLEKAIWYIRRFIEMVG